MRETDRREKKKDSLGYLKGWKENTTTEHTENPVFWILTKWLVAEQLNSHKEQSITDKIKQIKRVNK